MSNSGFNVTWDGKDLTELKKSVKALGDVPQKCVTSAAGKAATLTKRAIKAGDVPVRTGAMKRGIIRTKKERSRVKGKAVYRIDFKGGDEANSVFQKTVKDPGAAGSTQTGNGHAYYPYSMEFGYIARDGHFVPGHHFMRDGAEESRQAAEAKMVKALTENLDKEWMKQHGH